MHMKHNPMRDIIQPSEIIDKLRDFALRRNPGQTGFLLLSGKNGTGKTFIEKSLYWQKTGEIFPRANHMDAYFWLCSDLKQEYNDKYPLPGGVKPLRDTCKATKLLILDDLGANNMEMSGGFLEMLYAIINYRYENKDSLGTIISTNLTGEQFAKNIGHAFLSRISCDIILKLEGPDRRLDKNYMVTYANT